MLTLSDALAQDLATVAPRVRRIVSFTLSSGVTHHFCDGENEIVDDDGNVCSPSVIEAEPNSLEVDAFTRETSFGEMTIRMAADGPARQMVTGVRILRALVVVRLGTDAVPTTDYVTVFRGTLNPDGAVKVLADGTFAFRCMDAFALLAERVATFGVISVHPLEALRQLLADNCAADLFSSTGFDFEADTTRSHWNVSRYEERLEDSTGLTDREVAVRAERAYRRAQFSYRREPFTDGLLSKGQEVWGLAQELLGVIGGTLRTDAAGRLERVAYDAAAAPVAHWSRSVWTSRGEWDVLGRVCNRAEVTVALGAGTSGSPFIAGEYPNATDRIYTSDDTTSQTAHRLPDSTVDRLFTGEFKSPWLRALALIVDPPGTTGTDPILTTGATTMYLQRASEIGFTGARYRYGFRGYVGPGRSGGIQVTSSSISGNVLTLECAGHWLETGAYITTEDLSANVTTAAACTVVDADTVTVPLVAANNATNGGGWIAPQQDPLDTLADGRVAYFLLVRSDDPAEYEVVRATAGQAPTNAAPDSDPRETSLGQYSHPGSYQYTIERAQFGTTALEFPGGDQTSIAYDITPAVEWAQARLDRHAYGAPAATFRTLLSELGVQIGDFVTVEDPDYAGYLVDGATETGPVFEVTSKGVSGAEIEWGLTWVRDEV